MNDDYLIDEARWVLFSVIEDGNDLAVKDMLYGTRTGVDSKGQQKLVRVGMTKASCHDIDPATGDTALHAVLKAPTDSICQLETKYDIALRLMLLGIDMTVQNKKGDTALKLAERMPETVGDKHHKNMLLKAKEAFDIYHQQPPAERMPETVDSEHYENMLLKAKEAFDKYYQQPPASAAGPGRQLPTYDHDLSSVSDNSLVL